MHSFQSILHQKIGFFFQVTLIQYTLFALPLALMGSILPFADTSFARNFDWSHWTQWIWIIIAVVCGRTGAMGLNRVIDAKIDALNPRTQNRVLPQKQLSPISIWIFSIANLLILVWACFQVNSLCAWLSPLFISLICLYSFCKRMTALRHFVLGSVQFFVPFCAWIAITGSISSIAIGLGLVNLLWMSAKDIIYSLQDEAFQRAHHLCSMPVAIGTQKSLQLAQLLQVVMVGILIWIGMKLELHTLYYLGVFITATLLSVQQYVFYTSSTHPNSSFFFKTDAGISLSLLFFTLMDVWPNISSGFH